MTTRQTTITNTKGIHVRPSIVIAAALKGYSGAAAISRRDGVMHTLNSSPLSVLGLGLSFGETVKICVNGPDEDRLCEELCGLFSREYDFG